MSTETLNPPSEDEENAFEQLLEHMSKQHAVALLTAKRKQTGARELLMCLVETTNNQVSVRPVAILLMPDAIDDYEVPEGAHILDPKLGG